MSSQPSPGQPPPAPAPAQSDELLANLMSLSRIALAAVLWKVRARPAVLLSLMGVAAVTDLLDGFLARHDLPLSQRLGLKIGESTGATGEWLDPLCDKIFIVSLLGVLLVERRLGPRELALIGLRDVAVAPMVLLYWLTPALRARVPLSIKARRLGKLTTVAQFVTAAPAGLGLAAVVDYARCAVQQGRRSAPAAT